MIRSLPVLAAGQHRAQSPDALAARHRRAEPGLRRGRPGLGPGDAVPGSRPCDSAEAWAWLR